MQNIIVLLRFRSDVLFAFVTSHSQRYAIMGDAQLLFLAESFHDGEPGADHYVALVFSDFELADSFINRCEGFARATPTAQIEATLLKRRFPEMPDWTVPLFP